MRVSYHRCGFALTDTTQPAWTDLRRRRRQYTLACALFVPIALASLTVPPLIQPLSIFAFLLPPWVLLLVVTAWRAVFAPCPACGRPYFFPSLLNLWSRRCAHCGLPKWSDPAAWGRERPTAGNAR